MFKGEWTSFVSVAVKAKSVLGRCGAKLASEEPAVRVVTISAAYQAFIHAMVKRLGKIRLNFQVTTITKLWLRRLQKLAFPFGMMNGMTVNAPNIIFQVLRAQKVSMLFAELVTAQATFRCFFPRQAGEADDLGRVSRLGMLLAGSMTGLASLPLRARMFSQIGFPVRPLIKALAYILVAGLTRISTYLFVRINFMLFITL